MLGDPPTRHLDLLWMCLFPFKKKSEMVKWLAASLDVLLLMEEILHKLIRIISHYLQGFFHPRWCMISSINSRVSYLTNPFCILVSQKKHRDSEDLALASTLSKSLGD